MNRYKRSDLSAKYNISTYAWKNKSDIVLEHLKDYMDIVEMMDESTGRYYYEIRGEEPDWIPKVPRKTLKKEKIKDYSEYVKNHLSEEYKPNSKARMSKLAINDFSRKKYSHNSIEAVSRRYVGPAMDKYGDKTNNKCWVDYETYELMTEEQIEYLRKCFKKNNLTEEVLEDIAVDALNKKLPSEEKQNWYRNAIDEFRLEYGFIPVKVNQWKKK